MMEHSRLLTRGWALSLLVAGFLLFHLFLFLVWRHANPSPRLIPGALVSVAIVLAVAKHVGLFAVVLRRCRSMLRRQR